MGICKDLSQLEHKCCMGGHAWLSCDMLHLWLGHSHFLLAASTETVTWLERFLTFSVKWWGDSKGLFQQCPPEAFSSQFKKGGTQCILMAPRDPSYHGNNKLHRKGVWSDSYLSPNGLIWELIIINWIFQEKHSLLQELLSTYPNEILSIPGRAQRRGW